jgi:hypothetical protein
MTAKIISIETKKCCDCGKTLEKQSEQFILNDKQAGCLFLLLEHPREAGFRRREVKSATQIEIPKFLSHLKTYGGYPVPCELGLTPPYTALYRLDCEDAPNQFEFAAATNEAAGGRE